jgi:spermidine/putrescine-binding protein
VAERLGADEEKGLKVVYMSPKEKPSPGSACSSLLKGTPRRQLAHAYANAWVSAKSGKWLEDNYGYGHSNTLARPSSADLARVLQISNPKAVGLPNAYLDRDIPRPRGSTRAGGKR